MIRLFLLLSLPLYILDQLSKSWIVQHFKLYETEQEVIPGIFWLHHASNTGVAFGMFNGTQYANYAFATVSLAALIFIYVMHGKGLFPGKLSRTAVALLVSGIFGNLTDRLFRNHDGGKLFDGTFFDGYVVDFLRFGNLPDTMGFTGIAIIVASGLYSAHAERRATRDAAARAAR